MSLLNNEMSIKQDITGADLEFTAIDESIPLHSQKEEETLMQKTSEEIPRSIYLMIKTLLQIKPYTIFLIYQIFFSIQSLVAGIFIPVYGAQYFGNCFSSDNNFTMHVNSDCTPNYIAYNFYGTLFQSFGYLLTFLFGSFFGKLTDIYGRKPFFYFTIISYLIPRGFLIFCLNFYVYWSLSFVGYLNGGDFFTVSSQAYLADVIENKNFRIIGYAFAHAGTALGIITGSLIAIFISYSTTDHQIAFYVSVAICLLLLLYLRLFMKESLVNAQNIGNNQCCEHFSFRNMDRDTCLQWLGNPFKPLMGVFHHRLILYLALLSFTMAMIEAGFFASMYVYIATEFEDSSLNVNMLFGTFIMILSVSMIPASAILVPLLKKYEMNELNMMLIAIVIKILSLMCFICISFCAVNMQLMFMYMSAVLCGFSIFVWCTIDGFVSKYVSANDQGIVFGILQSYKYVACIFGPFGFGYIYVFAQKRYECGYIYLVIMMFLGLCAMLIVILPLRMTYNHLLTDISIGGQNVIEFHDHLYVRLNTASVEVEDDGYEESDRDFIDITDMPVKGLEVASP